MSIRCFGKTDAKNQQKKKGHVFKPSFKCVIPKYGAESRLALMRGIERVSKTACLTLGPGGRNVVLEYENGSPKITKDGVTVVKSIFEKTRDRDLGAKLLKRVANSTNVYAGDGTTTSTLISKELVSRGFNAIEFQGAHPISMKKGMDAGLKVVQGFLKDIAMPISQPEEVKSVCMVSSNHNERIAEIISKVLTTVGIDGVMNIVESPTGLTGFKLTNGLIFNRGLCSPHFVCEEAGGNVVEQSLEFDHPLVLVVADKIEDIQQILPILEMVKKMKKPLVLFTMDLQEEPLSTLVYNNLKGIVKCAAINIPWAGGMELEHLKDIATVTGATLVDNDEIGNLQLRHVQPEHFGKAKFIKVDEYTTSIVDGACEPGDLEDRMDRIKVQIAEEDKQNLKGVHKERLARLAQNIAEIQVGGNSEVERGEERDLIVDAINSAKSAVQGGVLPGGGIAMYHASKLLEDGLPEVLSDPSERIGAQILGQAMKVPVRQLIWNKTGVSGEGIIQKIVEKEDLFLGCDIKSLEICDMMDKGIIDSLNVVKVILEDSISLAGMVITTECILVKEKGYTPLPLKHYQDRKEFF